jgi:hypothetical protein
MVSLKTITMVDSDDDPIIITDRAISFNTFTRTFSKYKYIIKNGKIINVSIDIKSSIITTFKPHFYGNLDRVIVIDIECLIINGKFIPYAAGLYDGKFKYFYGLSCIVD